MRRAVFVNRVPASGKSTVASAISAASGWPLLTLDTIKEAFFNVLGTGDRDYNRRLGKASYEAIFALVSDFPSGAVVVVDAWFGFQPLEILTQHIQRANLRHVAEIWCHAPPEVVSQRYLSRVGLRPAGHLGAEYAPELALLAARAQPTGLVPAIEVETTHPLELPVLMATLRERLQLPAD